MSDAMQQKNRPQQNLRGPKLPSRGKILCVFENAQLVRHLEQAIVSAGFTLLRARHGMHGYWMSLTGRPDLILTEITDPSRDSDYLLDCLKRNGKTRTIPVVAMIDASQQRSPKASCLKEVALCLNKHTPPEDVIQHVRSLLNGEPRYRIDPDPGQARHVDAVFSELGHLRRRSPRIVAKFLKSRQKHSDITADVNAL